MHSTGRSFLRLGLSVVILAAAIWITVNRSLVLDQIVVWRYTPSPEVASIASNSSMSDRGRFLFYASQPGIEDRETFNSHCRQHAEKTAILGCYAAGMIYIFDVTDQRLNGIKEVTAAHEMLHAAYERLSSGEREHVNGLIDKAMTGNISESIARKLALYDKTEPGEKHNELHSMLGSEVRNLPKDLEDYYAKYFVNRQSVVELSERYEHVFNELEAQQKTLVDELNRLADEITRTSAKYSQDFNALKSDISSFNSRANSGGFSSQAVFDSERSRLVARQSQLNDQRTIIMNEIARYDKKRAELDALNLTAQGLQRSIDSSALPAIPTVQ